MDLIKTILTHHDDYSSASVFGPSEQDRSEAFTKAEAIRELISRIKDNMPDNAAKDTLIMAITAHMDSMSRLIFYKRDLNLED